MIGKKRGAEKVIKLTGIMVLIILILLELYLRYRGASSISPEQPFGPYTGIYLSIAILQLSAGLISILKRSLPFLVSSSALLLIGVLDTNRGMEFILMLAFSGLFIAYFEVAHLNIKISRRLEGEIEDNRAYVVRTYIRALSIMVLLAAGLGFAAVEVHHYLSTYGVAMLKTVYGLMLSSLILFVALMLIRRFLKGGFPGLKTLSFKDHR